MVQLSMSMTRRAEIVEALNAAEIMEAERDENCIPVDNSSEKLSENLEQMMIDVKELKEQICYFSDEKHKDENRIK